MGNANCSNCSQCKGDDGEYAEILTVDNKVSPLFPTNLLIILVWKFKANIRTSGKYSPRPKIQIYFYRIGTRDILTWSSGSRLGPEV